MARLIIKFWRLYVGRLKLTKNVDYKSRIFQVRVSMETLAKKSSMNFRERNFHRQSEDGWPGPFWRLARPPSTAQLVPSKSRIPINAQYIWCSCFSLNFVAFFTLFSYFSLRHINIETQLPKSAQNTYILKWMLTNVSAFLTLERTILAFFLKFDIHSFFCLILRHTFFNR